MGSPSFHSGCLLLSLYNEMGGEAMSNAVETQLSASISPLAGRPTPKEMLVDVGQLERRYFEPRPDVNDPN